MARPFLPVFYHQPYLSEVVRDVPVAVIDREDSPRPISAEFSCDVRFGQPDLDMEIIFVQLGLCLAYSTLAFVAEGLKRRPSA